MIRSIKRKQGYASEFSVVLTIFFFLLFPFINLVGFSCGAATCFLIAMQSASVASQQQSFLGACNDIVATAINLENSNFGKFARVKPVGGLQGCGVDMFIEAIDYSNSNAVSTFGPNSQISSPIDVSGKIYQVQAKATFDVGPFLNLGSIPFVGNIPIIGSPSRLKFDVSRALEHPEGFEGTLALGSMNTLPSNGNGGNTTTAGSGIQPAQPPQVGIPAGWNYPGVLFTNIVPVSDGSGISFWGIQFIDGSYMGNPGSVVFKLQPIFTDSNDVNDLLQRFQAGGLTAQQIAHSVTPESQISGRINLTGSVGAMNSSLNSIVANSGINIYNPGLQAWSSATPTILQTMSVGNNSTAVIQQGWQNFVNWGGSHGIIVH